MSETAEHGFGESTGDPTNGGTGRGEPPLKLVAVTLIVNGQPRTITIEPRLTLLDALHEKTRGNLAPEEDEVLLDLLGKLKMTYLEVNQAMAKQNAQAKANTRS